MKTEYALPVRFQSMWISSGIAGLDDILGGGLIAGRLYLVEGTPGAGKTTLGLQFLLEGRARGECGLFITLSETNEEPETVAALLVARRHRFFELTSPENLSSPDREVTLLHPWEVEPSETIKLITDQAEGMPQLGWFSTAFQKCGSWARNYSASAVRSWRFFAARKATVLLPGN